MSRDHTIRGIRYWDCDICGMRYRITDTALNSAGLRVCKAHCLDEGDYMHSLVATAAVIAITPDWFRELASQGFYYTSGLSTFSIATGGFE